MNEVFLSAGKDSLWEMRRKHISAFYTSLAETFRKSVDWTINIVKVVWGWNL